MIWGLASLHKRMQEANYDICNFDLFSVNLSETDLLRTNRKEIPRGHVKVLQFVILSKTKSAKGRFPPWPIIQLFPSKKAAYQAAIISITLQ
jgi:hypothetical protein